MQLTLTIKYEDKYGKKKKKKLRFMSCNVRSEENHQQIFLRMGG